jgi:hypothetical protein
MDPDRNSATGRDGRLTLREWVQREMPAGDVVSMSEPEPVLLEHNAVAVSRVADAARAVVLEWERVLPEDGAVGFLARGTPPDVRNAELGHVERGADGVIGHAAGRILRGSIPGAVIGAIVVTVAVWIINGFSPALIGAAFGGAALGYVAGFMISFAKGTAWGAAYRDSFVDDEQTELLVASIHADDEEPISLAIDAVADVEDVELYVVDRTGSASRVR